MINEKVSNEELEAFIAEPVNGMVMMPKRQRDRGVIPHVTNRDMRRTWKTLAGKAGLTKEIRDRLQNHTLQDVSSKSYDRYSYIAEKREAMDIWDKFVRDMIRDKTPPRLTVIAGTEAA